MSGTDVPQDYAELKKKLKAAIKASDEINDELSAHHETLAYYQRLSLALLRVLGEYGVAEITPDSQRLSAIAAKVPRLSESLEPAIAMLDGSNPTIPSKHLLNLLVDESTPDLAADNTYSIAMNPLSIDAWAQRNFPELVLGDFTPLQIPVAGMNPEYIGSEWNVGLGEDHDG